MRSVRRATVLLLAVAVIVTLVSAGCGSSTTTSTGSVTMPAPNGIPGTVNDVKQQANDAVRQANLKIIGSAIAAYEAENGKLPTDISQLTQILGSIPVDPAGGTYYIDASGNAAVR